MKGDLFIDELIDDDSATDEHTDENKVEYFVHVRDF